MRGMVSRRPRRFAAWLLAGWVAFWLFTVIQPCCRNLAVDEPGRLAAVQVSSDAAKTGIPCGNAPQDGEFCRSVSADQITPSDTAGAGAYRADLPFVVALVAIVSAPRHASAVIAHTTSTSPLSGAPLYLRHQRLLM